MITELFLFRIFRQTQFFSVSVVMFCGIFQITGKLFAIYFWTKSELIVTQNIVL